MGRPRKNPVAPADNDGKVGKNEAVIEIGNIKILEDDKGMTINFTFDCSGSTPEKLRKMRRKYVGFREPERDGFVDDKRTFEFSGTLGEFKLAKAPSETGKGLLHIPESEVAINGLRYIRACKPPTIILFATQQEIEFPDPGDDNGHQAEGGEDDDAM